ncbi:cutinase family protein [Nocardia brasiliensis]|uniref:cutinase family protein n=1 Tax=Nocardia brasiliensis TaxID=37326 RepID=UPI00189572B2|nr:cutinase family protein [Nocardia brasiliensis]MBF6547912.1 cutinase family protein [Nocardia brasiliensis]
MPVLPSSKRCVVVATMVAVGVTLGATGVASPASVHTRTSGCADTFNLFIPGTWETNEAADPAQPIGMLKPIAEAIQREHGATSAIYFTPYMARAFDNGHTYADSKHTALTNARKALRDYGTRCAGAKFTITGYSQGADAAGDIASDIGNGRGPISADRVLGVGLLSDPAAGTTGETAVGPRTPGKGIADPRPRGMGALSGRVTSICDPNDLYCSIQKNANPLLGQLGSLLSKLPSDSRLAGALTSDFSKADLPGLAAAVRELAASLVDPRGVDLTRVREQADTVEHTIRPLAELVGSGAALKQLATAPAGSAEHNAGKVLNGAAQADLSGAVSAANTISGNATDLLNNGVETLPAGSPQVAALSGLSDSLNGQIEVLITLPAGVLESAAGILALLKPSEMVNQALDVVAKVTTLDFRGILDNLALLPQKVLARDAAGAHAIAGTLNNQLRPLVDLLAAVDVKWVSQVLSMVPDSQGFLQIATIAASVLSTIDIPKLAEIAGRIQEVAWSVLEKLAPPPGQQPDPAGAAAALSALLPIGQDLAGVAMGMLTAERKDAGLDDLTAALATSKPSPGINLFDLIGDGISAAMFFASNAHVNYGALIVDETGRNAIGWLGDWLNSRIGPR